MATRSYKTLSTKAKAHLASVVKTYRETAVSYATKLLNDMNREELWARVDDYRRMGKFTDSAVFGNRANKTFWTSLYRRMPRGKKYKLSVEPVKYLVVMMANARAVNEGAQVAGLVRRSRR